MKILINNLVSRKDIFDFIGKQHGWNSPFELSGVTLKSGIEDTRFEGVVPFGGQFDSPPQEEGALYTLKIKTFYKITCKTGLWTIMLFKISFGSRVGFWLIGGVYISSKMKTK